MKDLQIIILPVGQLRTNCYLIVEKKSAKTLIIDPGDGADYIQRIISDKKLIPVKIVATHGHFDHILGALELQLAYNIPFLINKSDEFLMQRMQSSAKHFLGISTDPPPKVNRYVKDKEKIKIGKYVLEVIETPGHTPGGICLHVREEKILFVGDLIFEEGGVGRTDFAYSDKDALKDSISKIADFDPETKVYPGHGSEFYLKDGKIFSGFC